MAWLRATRCTGTRPHRANRSGQVTSHTEAHDIPAYGNGDGGTATIAEATTVGEVGSGRAAVAVGGSCQRRKSGGSAAAAAVPVVTGRAAAAVAATTTPVAAVVLAVAAVSAGGSGGSAGGR